MYIIGISAYYHDSAACLIKDGQVLAAAQEERFSRKKNDEKFPAEAILYCLEAGKISLNDVSYLVFYEKPFLKFERILETYLTFAPYGFKSFCRSMPTWWRKKIFLKKIIIDEINRLNRGSSAWGGEVKFSEHHLSHAASVFFCSPFDEAAILTIDGVGEWSTTSISIGLKNKINPIKEIRFPHSIGLLYSAITYFCGFEVNEGEYKVMGLAPFGEPIYVDTIENELVSLKDDYSFSLNMKYFNYCTGLTMTSAAFERLFKRLPRKPAETITQFHMDLAASIQLFTEKVIIGLAKQAKEETGKTNLCIGGGVALNCVANSKLRDEKLYDKIWIQPASGDAGAAIGAALSFYYIGLSKERIYSKEIWSPFLGPAVDRKEAREIFRANSIVYEELERDDLNETIANLLVKGKTIGWIQGRMEFGPRALGNRSILANPLISDMQNILNQKIKFREDFRPFAPSVKLESANDWFENGEHSPYMLYVSKVRPEHLFRSGVSTAKGFEKINEVNSYLPATTHIDGTSRVQTVKKEDNPLFYDLIDRFGEKTGCPILLNTSFNLRGEPIVCNAADALKCFLSSNLDYLVVEDLLVSRDNLNSLEKVKRGNKASIKPFLLRQLDKLNDYKSYFVVSNVTKPETREITKFYPISPFPNYDNAANIFELDRRLKDNFLFDTLKNKVGLCSKILEIGSGTCQLSLSLAYGTNNEVVALDSCQESLRLGAEFADKNNVHNVNFVNADLFDVLLKDNYFDFIWCNGISDQTNDPKNEFRKICEWLTPGGYIFLAFYNKYGRLLTNLRQMFTRNTGAFEFSNATVPKLDPVLIRTLSKNEKVLGFREEFFIPHGSSHTLDEVLDWFGESKIEFIGSIPSVNNSNDIDWNPTFSDSGTYFTRLMAQFGMLFGSYGSKGGIFVAIGRKMKN